MTGRGDNDGGGRRPPGRRPRRGLDEELGFGPLDREGDQGDVTTEVPAMEAGDDGDADDPAGAAWADDDREAGVGPIYDDEEEAPARDRGAGGAAPPSVVVESGLFAAADTDHGGSLTGKIEAVRARQEEDDAARRRHRGLTRAPAERATEEADAKRAHVRAPSLRKRVERPAASPEPRRPAGPHAAEGAPSPSVRRTLEPRRPTLPRGHAATPEAQGAPASDRRPDPRHAAPRPVVRAASAPRSLDRARRDGGDGGGGAPVVAAADGQRERGGADQRAAPPSPVTRAQRAATDPALEVPHALWAQEEATQGASDPSATARARAAGASQRAHTETAHGAARDVSQVQRATTDPAKRAGAVAEPTTVGERSADPRAAITVEVAGADVTRLTEARGRASAGTGDRTETGAPRPSGPARPPSDESGPGEAAEDSPRPYVASASAPRAGLGLAEVSPQPQRPERTETVVPRPSGTARPPSDEPEPGEAAEDSPRPYVASASAPRAGSGLAEASSQPQRPERTETVIPRPAAPGDRASAPPGGPDALLGRPAPQPRRAQAPPVARAAHDASTSAASSPLRTAGTLGATLLFVAAVIPTAARPPWEQLGDPASPTFVSLAFLFLVGAVHLVPLGRRARAVAATVVGALLVAFGVVLMSAAVGGGRFDGQPALEALFAGPLAASSVVLLAALVVPFALLWRRTSGARVGPLAAYGVGLALLALSYFGLHLLWGGGEPPAAALVSAGTGAPFLGDRIAAWLVLLPLVAALTGALAFLPRHGARAGAAVAMLIWASTVAPLVVLSLFVAKSEAWQLVLAPLEVVCFFAVALLYLPAAAAELLTAPSRR